MSYGDGFASLLGVKFSKRKYRIWRDEKSYVGSASMFVFTFITIIVALLYYGISITQYMLLVMAFIALVTTIVEALTPKGLDNLSVPFVAAFLYWIILIA